jgi:hypothetical protein
MPLLSPRRALVSVLALAPLLACGGDGNQMGAGGSVAGGSPGSGGSAAAGGSSATPQTGGSNGAGAGTGGAVPKGGTNGTGGALATGGATGVGGRTGTGGAIGTGGRSNTGGSPNTGGSLNAGGTGTGATGGGGSTGNGASDCSGGPLATSIAKCVIVPPPSTGDYHQDCVDTINKIRLDCMCLPPLARWTAGEACADQMAEYDTGQSSAHAGFKAKVCTPGGTAQCECPDWGSVSSITQGTSRIESCLAMMWHEVDNPSGEQGHYQAMSSKTYTKVACGINSSATNVWAVQNYSR